MNARKPVRIAIVQREPLVRDLLRLACSACNQVEVWDDFGDADAAAAALEQAHGQARTFPIDVLVADVTLWTNLDGLDLSRQMRKLHPKLGIVLLGDNCQPTCVSQLGAVSRQGFAFLSRISTADFDSLRRSILAVADGKVLIDHVAFSEKNLQAAFTRLTARQLEILHLVAQGYSNAALAEALHLSPRTVENHLAHIYKELDVNGDDSVMPRVRAIVMYLALRYPALLDQLNPRRTGAARTARREMMQCLA